MSEDKQKLQGEVIWYNERSGYGFVRFAEEEIFIHRSTLRRFGLETIYPGDLLTANISQNESGAIVDELLSLERAKPESVAANTEPEENEVRGTVKFFNSFKGYGFVSVGDDQPEVFVHLRTLRNCGINHLMEGQQILLQITDEGKGPQASEVRLFASE